MLSEIWSFAQKSQCGRHWQHAHTHSASSPARPVSIATANKLIKCQSNWFSPQVPAVVSVNFCVCVYQSILENQRDASQEVSMGRSLCECMLRERWVCWGVVTQCAWVHIIDEEQNRHSIHLILDIQWTFLPVEEPQGLHVAVSCRIVDGIGSTLRFEGGERFQDLSLTFSAKSPSLRLSLHHMLQTHLPEYCAYLLKELSTISVLANTLTIFWFKHWLCGN